MPSSSNVKPFSLGNERYAIQRQLGKKAGRQTLLARDLQTQQLVVVKLLTFNDDFEWDDLKLFEREAATLRSLSHAAIPRYLDYFEFDVNNRRGFALVQTYIEAQSLEQHLKAGRTFSELEVKQIAKDLLEILAYLHDRQPPVIHRDLKPSNVLLSDRSGNSPGQVYLVDFGSVQTLAAREGGTITVVGTYGYMPPEQFGGRATPASDLYSLGAALIYLATGSHPADLPQDDLQIQFEPVTHLSSAFINWLKQMTQPSLKRRFASAQQALKALQQPHRELSVIKKPFGSKIRLIANANSFEILVPPSGGLAALAMAPFAIAWNTFIFFWTSSVLFVPFPINLLFSLFSLPFWTVGAFLAGKVLFSLFGSTRLRLNDQQIVYVWEMFGLKFRRSHPISRNHINKLIYVPKYFTKDSEGNRLPTAAKLSLWVGAKQFSISGNINEAELEWIAEQLSRWLDLPITEE